MAVDSVFGGQSTGGGETPLPLSNDALALLNQFLTDTLGSSLTRSDLDGAPAVVGEDPNGNIQGAVAPPIGIVVGGLENGVLTLELTLPNATGLVFGGQDNATPEEFGQYLRDIIDEYAPTSAEQQSLYDAVEALLAAIHAQGVTNVVVRVFDLLSGDSDASSPLAGGLDNIVIDSSSYTGVEVFAINLSQAAPGQGVIFKGVANALVAGMGSVSAEGSTAIHLRADLQAQSITGGDGNDTLVGGGGNDTLTGGLGDDVFGFTGLGHHVVTDFGTGHDKLAFEVPGVTTLAQLGALVTGVEQTSTGVTYHFGHDASITLVGVSAAQVTTDLILLSI